MDDAPDRTLSVGEMPEALQVAAPGNGEPMFLEEGDPGHSDPDRSVRGLWLGSCSACGVAYSGADTICFCSPP